MLHNNAKAASRFLKEAFLEADNIRMINRCQNPDLIQGILFLFDTKFSHFYLSKEISKWLTFKLCQKNDIEKSADELDGMSNYEYEN